MYSYKKETFENIVNNCDKILFRIIFGKVIFPFLVTLLVFIFKILLKVVIFVKLIEFL